MTDRIDTLVHDAVTRVPDAPGDLADVRARARQRTRYRTVATSALALVAIAAVSAVALGAFRGPVAPVIGDGSAPGEDALVVTPGCLDTCGDPEDLVALVRSVDAVAAVEILEPEDFLSEPAFLAEAEARGMFRLLVRPVAGADLRAIAHAIAGVGEDRAGPDVRGGPAAARVLGTEQFDRHATTGRVEHLATLAAGHLTAWRVRGGGACVAIADRAACDVDRVEDGARTLGYVRDDGLLCTFGTVAPDVEEVTVEHADDRVVTADLHAPAGLLSDVFVACTEPASTPWRVAWEGDRFAGHHATAGPRMPGTPVEPLAPEAMPPGVPTHAELHRAIEAAIAAERVEEAYASNDPIEALGYALELYLGLWEAGSDRPDGVASIDVRGVTKHPQGDRESPLTVHLDVTPERSAPYCAGLSPRFDEDGGLLGYGWIALPGACSDTLPQRVLDDLADGDD